MHITAIETLKKSGRVRVITDSGIRFPLYKKEIKACGLKTDMELSEDQYQKICEEILNKRASRRLLYLLQKQDRTEWQLRQKLIGDGYPDNVIDAAIDYVRSFHYVDDFRYACSYIRCHQEQKSRMELQILLRQKGVPPQILTDAFEECYSMDEQELAEKLLRKRGYYPEEADEKEKRRTYQYLARKGFRADIIRHAMHF